MLRKENRLSSGSILAVLKKGRKIDDNGLRVSYITTSAPVSRCAFIISRKVDARATKRNEIKRKLSVVWWEFVSHRGEGNFDMVVLVKAQKGLINIGILTNNLGKVLERI